MKKKASAETIGLRLLLHILTGAPKITCPEKKTSVSSFIGLKFTTETPQGTAVVKITMEHPSFKGKVPGENTVNDVIDNFSKENVCSGIVTIGKEFTITYSNDFIEVFDSGSYITSRTPALCEFAKLADFIVPLYRKHLTMFLSNKRFHKEKKGVVYVKEVQSGYALLG